MTDIIYSIIIFPLVRVIELSFLFVYRIFENFGIAILGVSAIISVITLPLYFMAERYQKMERGLQKQFKPKVDRIKSAFKGDERYMILSTYYKQNHYHPIYALRGSFGLLIQIPFFIAAYSFLSHFELLQTESFLSIKDLGKPDALLSFFGGVNVLPVLMAIINLISGVLYTNHLPIKDKIQVYGTSLLFLVLLYNSPAGLVLYWTGNNVFSLVKNILSKTKYAKGIVYISLCVLAFFIGVFVLFFHHGAFIKRIIIFISCLLVFVFPFLLNFSRKIYARLKKSIVIDQVPDKVFILSLIILFLLAGFVIPSQLISSSTVEFSFIESYKTPFPFIINTLLQSLGFFIFWPLCIYFLSQRNIKNILSFFFSLLCVIVLINTFIFPAKYGFLTITLAFLDTFNSMHNKQIMFVNVVILCLVSLIFIYLFLSRKRKLFYSFQYIIAISLLGLGIFNLGKIGYEYRIIADNRIRPESKNIPAVYNLSSSGKNIIVIFLDKAVSGYLPYIFEEKPELYSKYSGFVYYPNCVSFGRQTIPGAPPLFGGYEYTPEEINKKSTILWTEKANDAYFVQFKLFLDGGGVYFNRN